MRTLVIVASMALVLSGCQTYQQQRAATGALVGAGTGAVIGGVAGGGRGAGTGALIGAGAGAMVGAATAPRYCNAQTASGKWVRVRC